MISTTLDIYSHVMPSVQREAAEVMQGVLGEPIAPQVA